MIKESLEINALQLLLGDWLRVHGLTLSRLTSTIVYDSFVSTD